MKVPCYRWRDGTTANLVVTESFFGISVSAGSVIVKLSFARNPKSLYLESPRPKDFQETIEGTPLGRKLCGLALDLVGAPSFPLHSKSWNGLLLTHVSIPTVLPVPSFVSNEDWSRRYELAKSFVVTGYVHADDPIYLADPKRGTFLGVPEFLLVFALGERVSWSARWGLPGAEHSTKGVQWRESATNQSYHWSAESAVDEVLDRCSVLPESEREAWEAENVERGEFLLPTPEEIELFRMLGEELPFFWGEDQLEAWLSERSSS